MSPKSMQNRRCFLIAAVVAVIAATTPIANASATWIPDLVFPDTVPVPMAKPERTVTGSISRESRTPGARQNGSGTASKETQKDVRRGSAPGSKEAQR